MKCHPLFPTKLLILVFLSTSETKPLRPSTIDTHYVRGADFMKLCWFLKVDPLEIIRK